VQIGAQKKSTQAQRAWVDELRTLKNADLWTADDMQSDPAIRELSVLRGIVGNRIVLAIALGRHLIRQPMLLQVLHYRLGPALRELQVVLRRAATIGVAAYFDDKIRI
jgi:hypothetical protein